MSSWLCLGIRSVSISSWCRLDMETISALLSLCEGNPSVIGGLPSQMTSSGGLWCFLCCQLQQAVKQTAVLPLIWDAMALMWYHCNVVVNSLQIKEYHLDWNKMTQIYLWAGIRSAERNRFLGRRSSNPGHIRGKHLASFRFEITSMCQLTI